jgi:hypothetical protein
VTPFDFLRAHALGDHQYDDLFREYAKEFSGRRQLDWSSGLRLKLDLGSVESDVDVAGELPQESIYFANLPSSVWRIILQKELRGEVLAVCKNGKQALIDYINDISGIDITKTNQGLIYENFYRKGGLLNG